MSPETIITLAAAVSVAVGGLVFALKSMVKMMSTVFKDHMTALLDTNKKLEEIATGLKELSQAQSESNGNLVRLTELVDKHISDNRVHLDTTARRVLDRMGDNNGS